MKKRLEYSAGNLSAKTDTAIFHQNRNLRFPLNPGTDNNFAR